MSSRRYPYRGVSEGLMCPEDTRTQTQYAKDTEINNIMKRFAVTGVLPNVGMSCLPADQFFGGTDFVDLNNVISEHVNNPVVDDYETDVNSANPEQDSNVSRSADSGEQKVGEKPGEKPGE